MLINLLILIYIDNKKLYHLPNLGWSLNIIIFYAFLVLLILKNSNQKHLVLMWKLVLFTNDGIPIFPKQSSSPFLLAVWRLLSIKQLSKKCQSALRKRPIKTITRFSKLNNCMKGDIHLKECLSYVDPQYLVILSQYL